MTAQFPRNRYMPDRFLAAFDQATARVMDGQCRLNLAVDAETEVEMTFPAEGGQCAGLWRQKARALLAEIDRLDNLVQASCESEAARSSLPAGNFALYLAYIELGPQGLGLGYFGEKVNTDWEARFAQVSERWEQQNF